jgi:transcriptional regulator with XRE-family HTH domain
VILRLWRWSRAFSAAVSRKLSSAAGDQKMSAVSKIIEDLRDRGGLKGTDVANIASVSPATVSRWTAGKALPHPKTQLIISDLRYVVDRLSEFYTPDETRLWLYSKHRLLNGERAIDLINQGDADKILAVIESLDEGSFT